MWARLDPPRAVARLGVIARSCGPEAFPDDRKVPINPPRRWHAAFAVGGGATRLVMTGPVPDADGHQLLRRGGRMWSSHVDPFVAGLAIARGR